MHELSIMQNTLDLVMQRAREEGAQRVHVIRLRVGALSGAVPEALQFAFDAIAPTTPISGANLVIEAVPARFWCEICQKEFEADNLIAECPVCGQPSVHMRSGRELEVASLEIE
jgi:hydrogenase nickel incorporation protein HypA/HybF